MGEFSRRIGIVTAYPSGVRKQSAIAYYAKTILTPLYNQSSDTFYIFADRVPGQTNSDTAEASNVHIIRCWSYGFTAPVQIFRALLSSHIEILHVEYDVYLYGGVVAAFLLPFLLRLFSVLKRVEIVTTLHGVVSPRVVTRDFLRENGFVVPYSRIGKVGFRSIYALMDYVSARIIVLEHALRDVLINDYGVAPVKVHVAPLPLMNESERPHHLDAVKRCGFRKSWSILFVGYASYYKGLDVLLDAYATISNQRRDVELHLIASRHPRLQGNRKYEEFYSGLRDKCDNVGAYLHDFLPDKELTEMLAAADVVVLPYTASYGGSAALNTALAARKPVLVSSEVYFDGALPEQVFPPDPISCARAILQFFEDPSAITDAIDRQVSYRAVGEIAALNHAIRCGAVTAINSALVLPLAEVQRPAEFAHN